MSISQANITEWYARINVGDKVRFTRPNGGTTEWTVTKVGKSYIDTDGPILHNPKRVRDVLHIDERSICWFIDTVKGGPVHLELITTPVDPSLVNFITYTEEVASQREAARAEREAADQRVQAYLAAVAPNEPEPTIPAPPALPEELSEAMGTDTLVALNEAEPEVEYTQSVDWPALYDEHGEAVEPLIVDQPSVTVAAPVAPTLIAGEPTYQHVALRAEAAYLLGLCGDTEAASRVQGYKTLRRLRRVIAQCREQLNLA